MLQILDVSHFDFVNASGAMIEIGSHFVKLKAIANDYIFRDDDMSALRARNDRRKSVIRYFNIVMHRLARLDLRVVRRSQSSENLFRLG